MDDRGDQLDCTKTADERLAFGRKLTALREAKRLSIDSLAQATRIQARYIECLEKGVYDKLPGEVFARGFVRNFAKAVGADPEEQVAVFGRCWKGVAAAVAPSEMQAESLKQHVQKVPRERRKKNKAGKKTAPASKGHAGHVKGVATYMVGIAAAAVLALGVRYLIEHRDQSPPVAATESARPAAETPQVAVESQAPADLPADVIPDVRPDVAETSAAAPAKAEPPRKAEIAAKPPEPKPKEASSTQAVVASRPPSAEAPTVTPAGPQSLEITVTSPVRVRMALDSGESEVKELKPDTYKLTFSDQANLLIYDASALKISYNGRTLGELGGKGRVRRLSFRAQKADGSAQF